MAEPVAAVAADLEASPAEGVAGVTMDEAAFRALYHRTAPALRGYLARVGGDRALADDLLQETYLRHLRSGFVGSSDQHEKSYLFRIATNLLRDHFRRRHRAMAELPADASAPDQAPGRELRHDVRRALGALPPRERAMLWLAYVEGSSHREIAATMQVREGSVRVMLFRARARLAGLLRASGLAPAEGKERKR